jgi:hypothetical protein
VNHSHYIGGGFAVAYFYEYGKAEVRYYQWRTCEHEFQERRLGNCWHEYKCKHCGGRYEVDSSG